MVIPILLGVFAVIATIFAVRVLARLDRGPLLEKSKGAEDGQKPFISIVVPMRNEEPNLGRCLEGLLNQDYKNYEIIAVDDRSTDNTLALLKEIARNHKRLSVIEGGELPEGWIGKNFAIKQGVLRARGEYLLFIDADTRAEPELLSSSLAYLRKQGLDMLSLVPFQEVESFWERVVQPIVFIAISSAYPSDRVNDPASEQASACGQFILVSRRAYEAVGGHEAIRDKIVEDFELAKLLKQNGYRIGIADGRKLIRTRMYRDMGEIWEGWTKNIFPGIGHSWLVLARGVIGMFAWGLLPVVLLTYFVLSMLLGNKGAGWGELATVLECLWLVSLNVVLSWKETVKLEIPRGYAFLFAVSAAMFLAILLGSAYKVASKKGVTWKGRVYERV